jgi:hypothetical protein
MRTVYRPACAGALGTDALTRMGTAGTGQSAQPANLLGEINLGEKPVPQQGSCSTP